MYWQLPPILILLVVVVVAVVARVRRRRLSAGETMQLLGQVPSGPTLTSLEYMFPGVKNPPERGANTTPVTLVMPPAVTDLPAGVRRAEERPKPAG